jgi:RNA recognition motif-containing protein
MQSDSGKLFIGGISWDTDEERLKGYFRSFGEVVEAVIMKDRTTGRARGFGFVVFADPAVAERVIKEKHSIDGRMVSFGNLKSDSRFVCNVIMLFRTFTIYCTIQSGEFISVSE